MRYVFDKTNLNVFKPLVLDRRLRALRFFNNLTQQEVAQALGIHRSSYACYELARTRPEYETLIQLAALYDVSIEYLLGVANEG